MEVREKLVKLIQNSHKKCKAMKSCYECEQYGNSSDCVYLLMADEFITNGVTVQEWISVKDKLPEVVSIHKGYRGTVKKSIRVLCVCVQKSGKTMVKEGYCEWYNDYQEPRWQIPGTIDEVTHWQYLPYPPKGE